MKVIVAEKCGFCQGVKNAIKLAEETLEKKSKLYSLGPIIHNTDVVDKLSGLGLETVDSVEQIPCGTVLIRSHGATAAQLSRIQEKGLEVVDATCVLVKRVQKIARELHEQGYKVLMIGDRDHPEVEAVVGSAVDVSVIGTKSDIDKLPKTNKIGVICQTTQSPGHFGEMIAAVIEKGFFELKVINTLCKEAIKRQDSAVELCKKVDIMFVLGGHHSANTKKLAELCKNYNNQTFHLQNWSELDRSILLGKELVGVTAGASTPDSIINEFVENLKGFDGGR